MECKNCKIFLEESDNYCNACGARVIRNRLTLKNLFAYFGETFLNYDNRFLQTFIQLYRRPEDVIDGYINGTRKKYVNAVSYFAIAVTVSGFFFFVFLEFVPEALDFSSAIYNMDEEQAKIQAEVSRKIFEYQSLTFFLSIPVLALISRAVFLRNKKYNYAEHLVISLYTYSQLTLTANILYFVTIWYRPLFVIIASASSIFQIFYFAYILKRMYGLTLEQIILKTLLFFVLLIPLIVILMIVAVGVLYFTGYMDKMIELEEAKRGITYMASSAMNWTS